MSRNITLAALACALSLGLAACEREGPMERAGEEIDEAASSIREGGKSVGERLDDAADEAGQATEQATDEARQAAEDATDRER